MQNKRAWKTNNKCSKCDIFSCTILCTTQRKVKTKIFHSLIKLNNVANYYSGCIVEYYASIMSCSCVSLEKNLCESLTRLTVIRTIENACTNDTLSSVEVIKTETTKAKDIVSQTR